MLSPPKTNKETESPYVRKKKEPLFLSKFESDSPCAQFIGSIREPKLSWGGVFIIAEVGVKDF